jgi:hypothetical protein
VFGVWVPPPLHFWKIVLASHHFPFRV